MGFAAGALAFVAGFLFVAAALWLFRRRERRDDGLGINPDVPAASDGSRFWGRRAHEVTDGKVVTKESGTSREKAAEALAEAEKAAQAVVDGYTQHAALVYSPMPCLKRDNEPFSLEVAEADENFSLSYEDAVLLLASVAGALEAHNVHKDAASSPQPASPETARRNCVPGATPGGPTVYGEDWRETATFLQREMESVRSERDVALAEVEHLKAALAAAESKPAERLTPQTFAALTGLHLPPADCADASGWIVFQGGAQVGAWLQPGVSVSSDSTVTTITGSSDGASSGRLFYSSDGNAPAWKPLQDGTAS